MSTEVDKLAKLLYDEGAYCGDCEYESYVTCTGCRRVCRDYADAVLSAGYRKPRTITFEEAESLNDGAAILTPGQIIFRKYDGFFKEGVTGWIRDQWGQNDPLHTRSLDAQMHFPATVIHEGEAQS